MEYDMEPISTDLRWRILHDNDAGMTIPDVEKGRLAIEQVDLGPGRSKARY